VHRTLLPVPRDAPQSCGAFRFGLLGRCLRGYLEASERQDPATYGYVSALSKPKSDWLALVAFLAITTGALALAKWEGAFGWAFVVIIVAAFGLGWQTRSWVALLVCLAPMLLALPFGYAEEYSGSEAPLVWIFGAFTAPAYALAIALGNLARRSRERRTTDRPSDQS
jgi:hypothetical protein